MENVIVCIFFVLFLFMYFCMVYFVFLASNLKKRRITLFHNAIATIYENGQQGKRKAPCGIEEAVEQITLNYRHIMQGGKSNEQIMLDLLEQLISYYDTYSDKEFRKYLRRDRDIELRDFILSVRQYMKDNDPYYALPAKEAVLLSNIMDAIDNNNRLLGKTATEQLSTEILNKERYIKKQERSNQQATVLSIVGLILTVFFGILSFI